MGEGAAQNRVRQALPAADEQGAQAGVRPVRQGARRRGATREAQQDEGTQRAVPTAARELKAARKVRDTNPHPRFTILLLFSTHCVSYCFRSSFNDFASKHGKDERYRGVDKLRDREDLFKEFVSELRRKEKDESRQQKDKVGGPSILLLVRAFADSV